MKYGLKRFGNNCTVTQLFFKSRTYFERIFGISAAGNGFRSHLFALKTQFSFLQLLRVTILVPMW